MHTDCKKTATLPAIDEGVPEFVKQPGLSGPGYYRTRFLTHANRVERVAIRPPAEWSLASLERLLSDVRAGR